MAGTYNRVIHLVPSAIGSSDIAVVMARVS